MEASPDGTFATVSAWRERGALREGIPRNGEAKHEADSDGGFPIPADGPIGLKVGGEAAAILVSYGLHRTGHHRAERIVPMLLGGPSWIAAVHNFSE